MKRINQFLTNNVEKILMIFLIIQPIIDVLTAVMLHYFNNSFTLGIILRFLFLGFMIYTLLFLSKNKSRRKSILYVIGIIVYLLLYSINIIYTKEINALGYDLKNGIKTFYFPICLVCIYEILLEERTMIKPKLLKNLFIIYIFFIIFPNTMGLGFDAYEITKSGSVGWFYTANEVGAIISILMPITIYVILEKKNKYLTLIGIVILLYVLTTIGTKGPFLSFLIIILYYLLKNILIYIKNRRYKSLVIMAGVFVFMSSVSVILLPKTNFYKNIVTHLEFLEVKKVSDIIKNPKILDHFIFSERLSFWKKTNDTYKRSNIISKLLGIGYIENYSTDQISMKMVEMDYVDIFYRQGIIGFTLYMASFILMIYKLINGYFKDRKRNERDKITQSYMLSLILSIVLAFLTGHVLTSPSVAIFVALIFNLFYNELYKGEKQNG